MFSGQTQYLIWFKDTIVKIVFRTSTSRWVEFQASATTTEVATARAVEQRPTSSARPRPRSPTTSAAPSTWPSSSSSPSCSSPSWPSSWWDTQGQLITSWPIKMRVFQLSKMLFNFRWPIFPNFWKYPHFQLKLHLKLVERKNLMEKTFQISEVESSGSWFLQPPSDDCSEHAI